MDDKGDSGRGRGGRRRIMDDDERAIIGAGRRRAERTAPRGYPASEPRAPSHVDDEITEPEVVLSRGATEVDLEILRRLGIDPDRPVKFSDIATIIRRGHKYEVEHRSGSKELGEQIKALHELLKTPPHQAVLDLQAKVAELVENVDNLTEDNARYKASVKWARGLAAAVIIAALGGIGTIAVKIWSRAEAEGEA